MRGAVPLPAGGLRPTPQPPPQPRRGLFFPDARRRSHGHHLVNLHPGIGTLYQSRSLRFSDLFRDKYKTAFGIDGKTRILELGCGPGALCQALRRWYPEAQILGTDTDGNFIRFAKAQAPDIAFALEDATRLSFADASFDVTLSNTVAEHVEPSAFFGEQYRVLAPGGVCLMLSARRDIVQTAPCIREQSAFEREIWDRVAQRCADVDKARGVCAYPMTESEYPLFMEKMGFHSVSTEYLTINLTPDDPRYAKKDAHAMINALRQTALDGISALSAVAPDLVTCGEIRELARLTHAKYEQRLALYDSGIRQWDTCVSLTMVLRGVK